MPVFLKTVDASTTTSLAQWSSASLEWVSSTTEFNSKVETRKSKLEKNIFIDKAEEFEPRMSNNYVSKDIYN